MTKTPYAVKVAINRPEIAQSMTFPALYAIDAYHAGEDARIYAAVKTGTNPVHWIVEYADPTSV